MSPRKLFGLCLVLLALSYAHTAQAELLDFTTWGITSRLLDDDGKLLGLFPESDHDFDNFISPMTNPVYFEDPRTVTEARMIFINHHTPAALGGDDVQVYATQLRAALTNDLSLIASKDGYIISHSPILNDGWADVSVGLKYNLWKDSDLQRILSVGTMFELPVGSRPALQGNGNGEFNLFASGGMQIGEWYHLVSAAGFRLPTAPDQENRQFYWSGHLDAQLGDTGLYIFTEVNWYHYISDGKAFPLPIGGQDLFNLGSVGVEGKNSVTGAYGFKFKPNSHMEIGLAYELPYTNRQDVMKNRFTVDMIFRY